VCRVRPSVTLNNRVWARRLPLVPPRRLLPEDAQVSPRIEYLDPSGRCSIGGTGRGPRWRSGHAGRHVYRSNRPNADTSDTWPVRVTCSECGTSWEYRGHSGRTQCRCGKKLYLPVATRRAAGIYEGTGEHAARPTDAARHSHVRRPAASAHAGSAHPAADAVETFEGEDACREGADLFALVLVVAAIAGNAWWLWHTFGRPWWERRRRSAAGSSADSA
jgi:hypothetical protein